MSKRDLTDEINPVFVKKLQQTFARIIPDIKVSNHIVAFFCDSIPELVTFSIVDGKMICKRNIAASVVEGMMQLKCIKTPVNNVTPDILEKIKKGFGYIKYEREKSLQDPEIRAKLNALRSEANQIFNEKYAKK